ncbi:MAG: response regulator [Saprospiraceae bacterium]
MKKILVIEDNLEVRENVCEILELANYKVYDAENGKIGVEKAILIKPDVILCDVMMPELDGFGVLKILSKNKSTYDIPFIFLTARIEKDDFRKGMGLGADDYITKPFDDTQLLEAIEIRLKKASRLSQPFQQRYQGIQQFFSKAKAQEEFEKLSRGRELRYYKVNDIIYSEGSESRWLYFVVTGSVKRVYMNDQGKELIVNIHKTGDFFGYFPILKKTPHVDSIVSLETSTIRLIPAKEFRMMLFNSKDFAVQFVNVLANDAEETELKMIELAYSSVRRKVANALLLFATEKNENRLETNTTRENLASSAGTAKETLIRTLSDFKAEGFILIEGKNIVILNKQRLQYMPH